MPRASPILTSETLHATCVAIDGRGVLIEGRSGMGKSDLALRLIDRGAVLVSDDYTLLRKRGSQVIASAPETIKGQIELRGLGIMTLPVVDDVPVALVVNLEEIVERMPESRTRIVAGMKIPAVALVGWHMSTAIKIELALRRMAPAS